MGGGSEAKVPAQEVPDPSLKRVLGRCTFGMSRLLQFSGGGKVDVRLADAMRFSVSHSLAIEVYEVD
jgi:hypothetical protein